MANIELGINAKDNASDALKEVAKQAKELEKELVKTGKAMGAMGAAITIALAASVKAFADEEKGVIRLRVAMRNVGIDYDLNTEAIERQITALQYKTGVADTEQRDSLASLVRITRDTGKAMDLMTLGMDVAIGTGRDLASATTLLMYALSGNWGQLEQYIPAIKTATDAEAKWAMLRVLFAGQAEEYGASLAGQMSVMKAGVGDLSQMIGGVLAPTVQRITSNFVELIKGIQEANPLIFKMGTWAATASAGVLTLGAGLILMVTQLPKLLTAMKTTWAFVVGKWIPSIAATTAAYVAQFVAAMAVAAATGQWWLVAAGVAAVAAAAALASAAIYGVVRATQALTAEHTEEKSLIQDVRQSTIDLTDAIKEQNKVVKEQEEALKGLPAYMTTALEYMLSRYESNIGTLNNEMVADLTSIKDRLVDTYGEIPDELQPAFDGLMDRLDNLIGRGSALASITEITADMNKQFEITTVGASVLAEALGAMPDELKPALQDMLTVAEANLGNLSDAFLETITQIRNDLKGLYDIPAEFASRLDTLIDAELALDSAARIANAALNDQTIQSLRAADAKGNLADAAEKLGFSEDEARQLIQEANLSMSDQQIAAYVAGEKKKTLAEIAEELGKSEQELTNIVEKANANLTEQSKITASGATVGEGGYWRQGTTQNIRNMPEAWIPERAFMGLGSGSERTGDTYNTNVTIKTAAVMGNEQEAREFSRLVGVYINQDARRHSPAGKI